MVIGVGPVFHRFDPPGRRDQKVAWEAERASRKPQTKMAMRHPAYGDAQGLETNEAKRRHNSGVKHFRHPIVGELHLLFEAMELSADTGLSLYVYSPEPDSPSEYGIRLLASWAATNQQLDRTESARMADGS